MTESQGYLETPPPYKDNLVERLRAIGNNIGDEAGDEIERLRADKDVQRSQDRNASYEAEIERLQKELIYAKYGPTELEAKAIQAEAAALAEIERLKEINEAQAEQLGKAYEEHTRLRGHADGLSVELARRASVIEGLLKERK